MVPKLRFREFDDCWVQCNIQDLVNDFVIDKPMDGNHGELHPVSADYVDNGIPFIMASDIIDGEIDFIGCKKISLEQANSLRKGFSLTGDILLTHKATIGNVAIVPELTSPFIMLTPQVTYYRVKNNSKLLNRYMRSFFETPMFLKELTELCSGATRPYIGISEQRKLPFRYCSIEEQTKIAGFLYSINEKITLLSKQYSLLCQYKKGMMQKIFSQEIRFMDENGEEHPDWELKLISDIAIVNPKSKTLPTEFIYIDLESVEKGILKKKNLIYKDNAPSRAQRLLQLGDVLFQLVRPYQNNNYLFLLSGNYVASTGYAQLRAKYCSKFLYQLLHLESFISEVMNRCTGTSYPAINSSDLASIEVGVPCELEQTKIANFLSAIDDKITIKKTELDKLKIWKQGLLQQMFV